MNSDTGEMRRYAKEEAEQAKKDGFDIELTEEEYVKLQKHEPKDRKEALDNMRKSPWGKKYFNNKSDDTEGNYPNGRPQVVKADRAYIQIGDEKFDLNETKIK